MEKQKAPGYYGQRVFEKVEKVLADGRRIVKKVATQTVVDCPCCSYRHVLREDDVGPFVYCTTDCTAMNGATPYGVDENIIGDLDPIESTVIITMEFDREGRLSRTNVVPAKGDWRAGLAEWMKADYILAGKHKVRY